MLTSFTEILPALVTLFVGGGLFFRLGGIESKLGHVCNHLEDHETRLRAVEKG